MWEPTDSSAQPQLLVTRAVTKTRAYPTISRRWWDEKENLPNPHHRSRVTEICFSDNDHRFPHGNIQQKM